MIAIVSVGVSCAGHSTKREAPAAPPQRTLLFPADMAWTRPLEQAPTAALTADRTHVFLPLENRVLAFDRETGDTAWAADVATRWPVAPADRAIYALTSDRIVQLDPMNGSITGQSALPGTPTGPATRDGDVFIIPIAPTSVMAWHVRESRVIWTRTLPAEAQLQPVVTGNTVFAALADGHVAALTIADGSVQWMTKLTGTPRMLAASPAVVVVGSSDRMLYVLRPATGALGWNPRTIVSDIVGVAADEKRVYVGALDNTVRAFDAAHGAQLWKAVVETRLIAPPLMAAEGLLVACADSRLIILAPATGRPQGTHTLPARNILRGAPLVLDDRQTDHVALVAAFVDQLIALKPKPPAPETPASDKPTGDDASAKTPATTPAATPATPSP
jgi:outer membrane protein assembly factor BamB